jgi:hypothetical protein
VYAEVDRSVAMRSPCAGAALDPQLWIVPNKALSLSLPPSRHGGGTGNLGPSREICSFIQEVTFVVLFIERTTPLALTKPNARKPARLAIMIIKTSL